jgi:SLT domain-containing protein
VDTVLRLLGQSTTLDSGVLSLIAHESGGNPNAINLTDSNAMAGHPSQGLMQTIPSTFMAYAGPYAGLGITNPMANIYAGVSYALSRWGAGMLAAGGRHDASGRYIGYDAGGTLDPGYHMVYNGTGAPEIVAPRKTFEQVMSGASGGSSGPASFTGNLYLDSGEFLGKVRGEAERVVTDFATAQAHRGTYNP